MVEVIKRNEKGLEVWRYQGKVIQSRPGAWLIEAFFDRDEVVLDGLKLMRHDRFLEAYFQDRWYNIFEIHAREDDSLKGWYCNVSTPAEFMDTQVAFNDLALDLLVLADGQQIVLDEDEFAAITLTPQEQQTALKALAVLQEFFKSHPTLDMARDFRDL